MKSCFPLPSSLTMYVSQRQRQSILLGQHSYNNKVVTVHIK